MKIYKVERTDNWSYDDYDAFVCVAENEDQARWMTPNPEYYLRKDDGKIYFQYFDGTEEEMKREAWPVDINDIKVTEINPTTPEVILASFNAG
jgi:hypothetical protein